MEEKSDDKKMYSQELTYYTRRFLEKNIRPGNEVGTENIEELWNSKERRKTTSHFIYKIRAQILVLYAILPILCITKYPTFTDAFGTR